MSFSSFRRLWAQSFPPKPAFTEKDVPDLSGKVCIVTGANTGVGKEVAQILYSKNAKVYVAARSESKALAAIDSIRAAVPHKTAGELVYLPLDLSDLEQVRASARRFLVSEQRLHLLFNNAGVGYPERHSTTAQGYELQLGVNNVGPFLLTTLLTPTLAATAAESPAGSVRVVWTSSSAVEIIPSKEIMGNLDYREERSAVHKYALTKAGNYFHSSEYARRHKSDGIVSVALNPGNLDSDFWRSQRPFVAWLLRKTILYPSVYGAYTTIYSGFSPTINLDNSGLFVTAFGRPWTMNQDKLDASKSVEEGGSGVAKQFWEWSEAQIKPYL